MNLNLSQSCTSEFVKILEVNLLPCVLQKVHDQVSPFVSFAIGLALPPQMSHMNLNLGKGKPVSVSLSIQLINLIWARIEIFLI